MVKTIKIDKDTSLTLSNNLGWVINYKNQFGHDILPDVMPIISAITKVIGEMAQSSATDVYEMIRTLDKDAVQDALIELCSIEFADFLHLVWALAKANDKSIEDPDTWVEQFDCFPLDVIAPEVFELLTKGLVSSKNLKSLRDKAPKAVK